MIRVLAIAMALFGSPALAASSDWSALEPGRIRLIISGTDAQGRIEGGIEVELPAGWKTYWRTPGDAGFPPRFDFSGSTNVGSLDIRYPYPERSEDSGFVSLVYYDHVVFPFTVTRADEEASVDLEMQALLGVCEKVCVPASARVTLSDVTGEEDIRSATTLRAYAMSVPSKIGSTLHVAATSQVGDDTILEILVPEGTSDLIVEGAPGAYLSQPERLSEDRFSLTLSPKQVAQSEALRFLVIGDGRADEGMLSADARKALDAAPQPQ